MKVQHFRRPQKSDILRDAPDWAVRLSDKLGNQLEDITAAISGRLTFADNIKSEIRKLPVKHNTEYKVKLLEDIGTPIGGLLLWTEVDDFAYMKWRVVDQKTVAFTVKWDSDPGSMKNVVVVFLGE